MNKFKEIFNNQDYAFGLAVGIVFCIPFLALLKQEYDMNQHVTDYYWWLILNEVVETDSDDMSMLCTEYEEITD